jgi:hypothetical protein
MHARTIQDKTSRIEDIVDVEQFPFHLPNDRITKSLIAECRSELETEGVYLLRNLIRPAALDQMIEETNRVSHLAYYCENDHNLFLDDGDPAYSETHIRNRRFETEIGSIASDYLGDHSLLKTLYRWDALTSFIAAALGKEKLYRLADPLGDVSINVCKPGDGHSWHYDESDFSVTLQLQASGSGGQFEYCSDVRGETEDHFKTMERVAAGSEKRIRILPFQPGTLVLFAGHDTLHQVTRSESDPLRLVPVLCFSSKPKTTNSERVRKLFWGRTGTESVAPATSTIPSA